MDYEQLYSTATKALDTEIEKNEQLQAELEKHRWIPVSEGLPKDFDKVFATNGKGIAVVWHENKSWYTANEITVGFSTAFITHWKPIILPKN